MKPSSATLPSTWRQIPMVYVSVLFILGILLNEFTSIKGDIPFYLVVILCFILTLSPNRLLHFFVKSQILTLLIPLTGLLHSSFQESRKKIEFQAYKNISITSSFKAEIVKITKNEHYQNLTIKILSALTQEGKTINLPSTKGLIKIKRSMPVKFRNGDLIETVLPFSSTAQKTSAPENMYYSILQKQGIQLIAYAQVGQVKLSKSTAHKLKYIRYTLRNQALDQIDKKIKNIKARAISKALLLGHKSDISEKTLESFKDSGTMHILAVSGLHVGIVALIVFKIIGFLFSFLHKYSLLKTTIVMVCLVFFAEISGGAPPVWRAVLVSCLYLIGRSLSFQSQSLNLVGSAAFIFLLFNHEMIFNLSFQLSFSAVIGIILIYPILENYYFPKGAIAKYSFGIIYMGISAQIAITPFSIYYFNQISLLSPLTSILAISFAFLLLFLGVFLFAIGWLHPTLSLLIVTTIESISILLVQLSELMSKARFSIITNIYFSTEEAWITGLAILSITVAYHKKSMIYTSISLILFAGQGFLHSIHSIQHTHCIKTIKNENTDDIEEIYLGREAFLLVKKHSNPYEVKKNRKSHLIKCVTTVKSEKNNL